MINMAQVLGRVGKIENRSTSQGLKVTNISMVTSKKRTVNGQKEEKVTWHNVTLFSKLAEVAEKYVSVGDLLYIQGEMDTQKYVGKDGHERTKFFIVGNDMKLMPKSKEHKAEPKEHSFGNEFEDSDLPF